MHPPAIPPPSPSSPHKDRCQPLPPPGTEPDDNPTWPRGIVLPQTLAPKKMAAAGTASASHPELPFPNLAGRSVTCPSPLRRFPPDHHLGWLAGRPALVPPSSPSVDQVPPRRQREPFDGSLRTCDVAAATAIATATTTAIATAVETAAATATDTDADTAAAAIESDGASGALPPKNSRYRLGGRRHLC